MTIISLLELVVGVSENSTQCRVGAKSCNDLRIHHADNVKTPTNTEMALEDQRPPEDRRLANQ